MARAARLPKIRVLGAAVAGVEVGRPPNLARWVAPPLVLTLDI